jgi:hypothetical protein
MDPDSGWPELQRFAGGIDKSKFSPYQLPGHMYQVEIGSDPEHFLDWEKPLKQQPQPVIDMVRQNLKDNQYLRPNDNGPRQLNSAWKAYLNERGGMADKDNGSTIHGMLEKAEEDRMTAGLRQQRDDIIAKYNQYGNLPGARTMMTPEDREIEEGLSRQIAASVGKGAAGAAQKLQAAGVPGIRYLDAGSRDAKTGTSNYVVFDPETVSIMRKYAIPGAISVGTAALAAQGGTQKIPSVRDRLNQSIQELQ